MTPPPGTSTPARRTERAVCPHDCPDACALLVEVEDDKVIRVHGDPAHPVTRGFLCNKVNRYHERLAAVYNSHQILRSMSRSALADRT